MTLKLALSITVDSAGAVTGVQQLDKALDGIGLSAAQVEREARSMEAALARSTQAARDNARAAAEAARAKAAAERAVGQQTIMPNRGADIAAYGSALDGLRAKYNPLYAAGRQYKAALDEIRMAERTGALTATEAAAALTRTKAAFSGQVQAINGARTAMAAHAAQGKLTADQSRQLAFQLNDVMVSLAGGMNPLMVALQQGSQITPLFGGIGGTLRTLAGAISPVSAGLAGLAAVTVGSAAAWNSYLKSTLEVQTALTGLGRNSGATRRELEAIAQANAAAGGMTVSEARSIEAQLLRTGKVGVESFAGVIRIARDFAATLGTDVDSAAAKLAEALADPAKGAAELQRAYGLLDGATVRYVERLDQLGRQEEARKLILDKLPQQLASHREALTGWARLWDDATRTAKGYIEAVGQVVDRRINGPSTDERIAVMERWLQAEKDAEAKRQSGGKRGVFRSRQEQIDRLEAELQVEKDYIRRKSEADKAEAERRRTEAQAQERADRAVGVSKSSPVNELAERRRQLQVELDQLEKGLQGGKLSLDPAEDAARRREINAAIEGKRAALEGLRPVQERQAELDRIDAAIAMARDPVTKAELAALREKIALEGQEMSAAERRQAIENARAKSLMDSLGSSRTRAADLRDEARARAAVNDAVSAGRVNISEVDRFMRTEQELRPLIIAHAKAEGAVKKELAAIIEQLRQASAAQAREEARTGALQHIAGQKERLETVRAELALIGASETTRSRMLALLEAEQTIRRGNIDTNSAEARQIRANAEAQASLTAELERQKSAYSTLRSFGERSIDAIIDKIAEQGLSWQSMGDLAKSIFADLNKEMMRLIIGNPLKNALFGSNLPTIADAQGLFGMLGGKNDGAGAASVIAGVASRAVGAMTVNAASVIVNGGVTGAAGNALAGITGQAGVLGGAAGQDMANNIRRVATNLGIQPRDLAAVISYETGGTFDPWKKGPTTQWGTHRGLIQWGEPQAAQYGVSSASSVTQQFDAIQQYLFDRGVRPGMGVMDVYSAVNAGRVGRYNASDAGNGGAWGTVADKVNYQFGPHFNKADNLLGTGDAARAANENLNALATTAGNANLGLDKFGNSLTEAARAMPTSGGSGAGGGGWLQRIFGGGAKSDGIFFANSATGGIYHDGGMVGSGGGPGRNVPWSVFAGAPRYHSGGLLPGERPIIAKDGEGIFTPRQMDNADALIRAVSQRPSTAVEARAVGGSSVTVINNGQPVSATKTERVGADGSRDITIVLDEMQAAAVSNANAKTYQAIRRAHGTQPALIGRSR